MRHRIPTSALLTVLLAAIYFAAARLGLSMAFESRFISLVWPSSGIAFAAVFLLGYRVAAGVFIGAFLINYEVGRSAPVALAIGAGNTLEAITGVALLRWIGFDKKMDQIKDVIAFVVLGSWAASFVSATIGIFSLALAGELALQNIFRSWAKWWLGDAMGILLVGSLLVVYAQKARIRWTMQKALEAVLLAFLHAVVTMLVFRNNAMPYLVFPLVFWASSRLGKKGAMASAALFSAAAAWQTIRGQGPFTGLTVESNLLNAQSFMAVVIVTGLAVAAARWELEELEAKDHELLDSAAERERFKFLSEASEILDSTLCYETTLGNITRFVVPRFADYCVIEQLDEAGKLAYLHVAHRNPAKEALLDSVADHLPDPTKPHPANVAVAEHRPVLIETFTPEIADQIAADSEHRRILRELDLRSYIVAPLTGVHFEKRPGVLIFARTAESGLKYDERDLHIADDLARRCSAAIENAELYEQAQRTAKMREDTVAIVSHDLKNPIAAIQLGAELMGRVLHKGEMLSDRERRGLESSVRSVLQAARRCSTLIQDLLDFAKTESGKVTLNKEIVQPAGLVEEVETVLRPLAEAKEVSLTATVPKSLWPVVGDRAKLYQVLSNLVGNAVKYIQKGGRVEILVEDREEETLFLVRDNGPGIASEVLANIFDRYRSLSGKEGGAGLGLSIAKGLVQSHGGRIWVESESGKGCSFYFTIPRGRAAELPQVA